MNAIMANQSPIESCGLAKNGFEILDGVLSPSECDELAHELTALHERERAVARGKLGGLRNLLRFAPRVAELASSDKVMQILKSRMRNNPFPVRAIFFDKTPDANWLVSWHQDLTIAVNERIETDGFECWTVKEGVAHVQPPKKILERMVTLRLHLDDCNADNGALKVIPRSHLRGKLRAADISGSDNEREAFICEVSKGGVLLMQPLLLHSSSPAKNPSHRRVLHIEYASDELPNGLRWYEW
jgi:ectoine hydroxylase-related dioxygenase (phytanoyl-CoA dioxygenase family)